ncbi:MAG: DNA adenine methylase [Paludibacteraceae bacterium]|nr:DNA adenine methylase [Paludibacteraceae bacterium]
MDNLQRFTIGKRRYIGCKAKLADWIFRTIDTETANIQSFCDIFAGTAIISDLAINKYKKVIINDFLFSNYIIYKAFYSNEDVNDDKLLEYIDTFNKIDSNKIHDNYFSINYGGKFFDYQTSKKIGFIRDLIEDKRKTFTEKEFCILLASLIYSIDKIANTLGHYEAYIKKEIEPKTLTFNLIDYKSYSNVEIYREDSNKLVRNISADIFYIDPPYNSRQYSRFYHLYENLVKWNKPTLSGSAMKPAVENMSEYCSSRAYQAFEDLILHLSTKYIAVSYNNTYHSKSSSSLNKITLEQINDTLSKRGETKVFEHSHQFFNAGKTNFDNHKELLFITKVNEKE